MCGLFGFNLPAAARVSPEQKMLLGAVLGDGSDVRGGDSWGAFLRDARGRHQIVRGLGAIGPSLDWPGAMRDAVTLMGHARKATSGAISLENSHPFEINHIIGAHNGAVFNDKELNEKYSRTFKVDSMHIFAHMAEELDMKEIRCYGAVEYIVRTDPACVWLCRLSSSADMAIFGLGSPTECRGIIWASTAMTGEKAIALAGLKKEAFRFAEPKEELLYYVKDGALYYTDTKIVTGRYYAGGSWGNDTSGYCGTESYTEGFYNYRKNDPLPANTGSTSKPPIARAVNEEQSEYGVMYVIRQGHTTIYLPKNRISDKDLATIAEIRKEMDGNKEAIIMPPSTSSSPDDAKAASEQIVLELSKENEIATP